jgi:hypothetical protein
MTELHRESCEEGVISHGIVLNCILYLLRIGNDKVIHRHQLQNIDTENRVLSLIKNCCQNVLHYFEINFQVQLDFLRFHLQ